MRVGVPSVFCGLLRRGVVPFFLPLPSFLALSLRGGVTYYIFLGSSFSFIGPFAGLGLQGARNILVGLIIPLTLAFLCLAFSSLTFHLLPS